MKKNREKPSISSPRCGEPLRLTRAGQHPKLVIAVGECGANGGEFGVSYASCGAVSNVIPVDAVIRGCPPAPLDLMRGILEAISKKI